MPDEERLLETLVRLERQLEELGQRSSLTEPDRAALRQVASELQAIRYLAEGLASYQAEPRVSLAESETARRMQTGTG
jgi:hypothetical protein